MAAEAKVFRAVITKKYRHNAEPFTTYEGPYDSASAARSRVTFWQNHLNKPGYGDDAETGEEWASGYVEEGTITWTQM